ncbi:ABC transporter permease subunit [Cohnella sp. CFH 77786]|uniref:ABC transporter permease n=1 Tax=Cohnella sp. CFH 77786 TaxID=2662265 RepID=UPI001C60A3BF|nr:ABC transporter permease subunit [Cohnella sp. CFH 77786]MBW5448899.1 ABC transporter permease subunit [Cohnella sp. CFH 77786]
MQAVPTPHPAASRSVGAKKSNFWKVALRNRYLYMMSLPFVIWAFVFSYYPLWGWLIAFQKWKPGKSIWEQKWVGFDQFKALFQDDLFYQVLRNTVAMSVMGLIASFTVSITFAIMMNELRGMFFKRAVQTISYLPHFVSWAVASSIITRMLSSDNGVVNDLLMWLGLIQQPVQWMGQGHLFWGIVTVSDVWKETGWNAIIYLAAMAGIAPELYEAAKVDGASRLRQIWHITLPGIRSTIIILVILSIGNLINTGFEKQFLLGNNLVRDYSQVLDLYSLQYGIQLSRYSFGTAINIFNSVVSLVLLFTANGIFKRMTKESII